MRDIKFRAWDGRNIIMPRISAYYQHYLSFCGNIVQKNSEGMDCFGGGDRWSSVEDLNLMQFTGLKDKNGVDIYEGDIVTGSYSNGHVDYKPYGEVSFGTTYDSDGWANGETLGWITSNGSSLADLVAYEGCEVIGNIHQNPELLEVSA